MIMPLTYSIAYGLIAGIVTFYIMEGVFLLLSRVFGLATPDAMEEKAEAKAKEVAVEKAENKPEEAFADDEA